MEPKLRAKAFRDIELLKNLGNDLREPHVKSIKGEKNKGIYELRIKFSNDIARIFYFTYYNNKMLGSKAFAPNDTYGFLRVSHSRNPKSIRNSRIFLRKMAIFSCFTGLKVMFFYASMKHMTF